MGSYVLPPEVKLPLTFSPALSIDRGSSAAWFWLGNLLVCQWCVLSNSAHRLSHGYNSLMKGSQAEQALPVVNIPRCTRGRYTSYFRELSCDCSCSLQFLHLVWTVLQKPINIFEFLSKFYLEFCSTQDSSHLLQIVWADSLYYFLLYLLFIYSLGTWLTW